MTVKANSQYYERYEMLTSTDLFLMFVWYGVIAISHFMTSKVSLNDIAQIFS